MMAAKTVLNSDGLMIDCSYAESLYVQLRSHETAAWPVYEAK